MVDARTADGGERKFFPTKMEAEGFAQAQRIRRTNEGGNAFDDRELARYGWTVAKAIRFALEHLRRESSSVPVDEAICRLIESKRSSRNNLIQQLPFTRFSEWLIALLKLLPFPSVLS